MRSGEQQLGSDLEGCAEGSARGGAVAWVVAADEREQVAPRRQRNGCERAVPGEAQVTVEVEIEPSEAESDGSRAGSRSADGRSVRGARTAGDRLTQRHAAFHDRRLGALSRI